MNTENEPYDKLEENSIVDQIEEEQSKQEQNEKIKPQQLVSDKELMELGIEDSNQQYQEPQDIQKENSRHKSAVDKVKEDELQVTDPFKDQEVKLIQTKTNADELQRLSLSRKRNPDDDLVEKHQNELNRVNDLQRRYKKKHKITRTFKIMSIFQPENVNDDNVNMNLTKSNKDDDIITGSVAGSNGKSQASMMMSHIINKSNVTSSSKIGASQVVSKEKDTDKYEKDFTMKRRNKEIKEQFDLDLEDFYRQKKIKNKKYNAEKKRICIIKDSDDWKFWWDTAILILAIWNSLTIPIAVAFEPEWVVTEAYEVADSLINVVFFIDILFAFNTSYFSVDGEEVIDRKLIAIRYMKGMFLIDLISSLPFSYIHKSLNVLSILKVVRIRRLSKMINKLSLAEETKAYIKILQLIFYLFLYMHLLGCSWYYIVAVIGDKGWIPPLDFIWAGRPEVYQFYDKDTVYRYMVSLYCAVLALGGNEMGPRSDAEIFLMLLILLGCAILNANIFGEMTVLVQVGSRKSSQFQEQVDVANTAMKNIHLPSDAQAQVRTYLITTQGTRFEQEELKKFIDLISPSIKQKVAVSIFSKIVMKNTRVKQFINKQIISNYKSLSKVEQNNVKENLVFEIVYRMEIESIEPDEVVIHQYAEGDSMYFVAKGECQVNVSEGKKKDLNPKFLRPGDFFGEISLIYGCKRTAKVFAKKYSTLAKLSKNNFRELTTIVPQLIPMFQENIFTYQDRMLRFIKRSLRKVPYFATIDEQALFDIIYSLKTERFQKGQILQQPGDDATSLYFLQQGIIEVYTRFEGKEFVLERLFRGSVINYRTFFMEEHGKVYIRFSTQSIMQDLAYETMEKIAQKFPAVSSIFNKYKLEIVKKGDSIPLDYIMHLPKRVNRKLSKIVRQQLTIERKGEIDDMLQDKRDIAERLGVDLTQEDELELVRAHISEMEIATRMTEAFRLENLLKNVVIRRLSEIREVKGQKTIKESVEIVIQQNAEKEAKSRIKLKKKILRDYEEQVANNQQDKDLLYNRILINMDRLLKILTAHSQAVDSLERKLEIIQSKKGKLEQHIQSRNEAVAAAKTAQSKSQGRAQGKNVQGSLYDSRDFSNFPVVHDDLMSDDSEEQRRDLILANLSNAQLEPNPDLMALYHFPIQPNEINNLEFDSNSDKLNEISSGDSDHKPSEISSDEKEEI